MASALKWTAAPAAGLAFVLASAALAAAQPAQLLKDINTVPSTIYPFNAGSFTRSGGFVFFIAYTDAEGTELWRTDGTPAGTVLAKDILPGGDGSGGLSPFPGANLVDVNGILFFSAFDHQNGRELWKSDGTPAGTVLVRKIGPGIHNTDPRDLVNVDGILYFTADDGVNGRELWKSDGTAAGTVMVADLAVGPPGSPINFLTNVNGTLFFNNGNTATGPELWKSDGTAAGTVLVKDIVPGGQGSFPANLTAVGATLFFTARDGTNGNELWKSDGTEAGTVLVKDIFPGINDGSPFFLTNVGGTLFFNANDGTFHVRELWKSDGTTAGTVLVKDIWVGGSSFPQNLTNVNGTLFFSATDPGAGNELWKSDGTEAGTMRVKDIGGGPNSGSPTLLSVVGTTLFFRAIDFPTGYELWKSDGTEAGTVLVKDIWPGTSSADPSAVVPGPGGAGIFRASDGGNGFELWKTDGTMAGTTALTSYASNSSYPASFSNVVDVGGTVFFSAHEDATWNELWKSDGTTAGTVQVKDIAPGIGSSNPQYLTNVGGVVLFSANSSLGYELWKSDGTTAGTVLVKDILPGGPSSNPSYLTNVNGTLFFSAADSSGFLDLWKSDGTEAGTVLVKDINPTGNANMFDFVSVGATLFFFANDGVNGDELWRSDGTTAGTVMVTDIRPGPLGSNPDGLTNVNGTLFFSATDGTNGNELWRSDGTEAGTVMVKDIFPGAVSSSPRSLTAVNTTLFLVANEGTNGFELWKSDGTAAGTVLVKDVWPGAKSSTPANLLAVGNSVYFSADEPIAGTELWKSDGTAAGTVMINDIVPGSGSSSPIPLATAGGIVYFSAWDPIGGRELWNTDGTSGGTARVQDIGAGVLGGIPFAYSVPQGIFFSAYQQATGFEPWLLAAPTISVSDCSIVEGNAGTSVCNFTLGLSRAVVNTVTVNYAAVNGSAVAPSDYTAVSGSASFPPGTVAQTIGVPIVGDTVIEADEVFFMTLGGASGATIADALGLGTIINDDVPSLSINDVSLLEGSSGTTNAVFTVTLSQAAPFTVGVSFATANGSAVAPGDYTAVSGSRTFSPGTVTQTISVPVAGDVLVEPDETFFVSLGGASGATIADPLGVGTILNDDLPTLAVNDVVITEGNTGSQNAVFTVTLSDPVGYQVTVNYGASAVTATGGVDFGTVGGTLIFPAGTTTMPAAVPVFGDWILEANETFNLNLSAPSGATLADPQGLGTITDEDTAGLSIADVAVRERVGAMATVTFTVTLAPASGGTVTVDYATANGTATAGSDYQVASGTLTFASGETTKTVTVTVNADALVEEMETFSLNLSGVSGAAIAHGTATGRILDPPLGGDFNADGNNDLVWRHDVSGQNVIWHMDGTTLLGGTFTTPAALQDASWKIVGTNDFNADGRPDLLWRHRVSGENVLWYMNGAVLQGGTFLTSAALADVNWGMSGTGDFNLDGKPDIVWRHAVSGEVVVWYMNGSVLQSGEFLTPSAFTDLNWQSVGTGDFNLDGRTDILWRHAVAGENVVWYMHGSSLMSGAFLDPPALVDVNWRMVATGDYNDDGKVDIVWRHSVSGQNVIWFMDGVTLTGGGFTTTLDDANWKIVGPR